MYWEELFGKVQLPRNYLHVLWFQQPTMDFLDLEFSESYQVYHVWAYETGNVFWKTPVF